MSSIPADIRTRPSVMPSAARWLAGTDAWVMVAGWEIRVSTPPRLSARDIRRTPFEHPPGRFQGAELEGQHAAEPLHLAARQRVLGMVGQPGKVDALTPWDGAERNSASAMPLALCCAIRSGSVLVPRSTSQASNGPRIAPGRVLHELQPLDVLVAGGDDDAADAVAVAVEVFRGAVHDQVGAELDRPLQARARERVVDDEPGAVPMREIGCRRQVRDPHDRVARRFDEQQPCGRGEGSSRGVEIGRIHVGKGELVA